MNHDKNRPFGLQASENASAGKPEPANKHIETMLRRATIRSPHSWADNEIIRSLYASIVVPLPPNG